MRAMRNTIWWPLPFLFAACASYPDDWVDPTSSTGLHDASDDDLESYGGQLYRIQWRGNPRAPEQSLWRLRGDELAEQVVPWGPWEQLRVTDDRTFFVRDRGSRDWLRRRADEPVAVMNGWNHVFRAVAEGFLGHYVLLDEQTALIRIDAAGRELARVAGDDFELAAGGLLVRRGDQLIDYVDRDLRPRTTAPLEPFDAVGLGKVWLVRSADGVRVATERRFVGDGPYAEVRPLSFGEGRRVEVWALRRTGDAGFGLAGTDLELRTAADFVEIERAAWVRAPGVSAQRRVVVVQRDGEAEPWRVLSWDEDERELARADDVGAALQRTSARLLTEFREAEDRARVERGLALERALAKKREEEQRERDRRQQEAEERRQRAIAAEKERVAFRQALVKGGIAEWEIDRYERNDTPMVVVGGKSYAGQRIVTVDGVVYDGSIDWEHAPKCFLWWDGDNWQSAMKVNTGDGYERVLMQWSGRLQTRLKNELNGTYIVPVAAAELLAECGRCGGDGVERRWREVLVYDKINGYRWEQRRLRVGNVVRQGNFVHRKVFVPGTCNRCWGHGVEPFLPK